MIRIIDYKAGNAPSVMHAINHLGFKAGFACAPKDLTDATHIILPGVGSAKATMDSLKEMSLLTTLEEMVLRKKTLFLGICVGMQILFEYSEEGSADCLGWLKGKVRKFDTNKVRVPQMGWNCVRLSESTFNTASDDYFYFVNSYYAVPDDNAVVWGTADYGGLFTAAVHKENIFATQFHIEKSGEAGLSLLGGFIRQAGHALSGGDVKC